MTWFGRLLLTGPLVTALIGCGTGEDIYPNRPIQLICPWAVGGGTDRLSRHVATFLEREFGVPVNVVNAAGGAGVTGHSRGARARPDGYTLTMMTVEINMLHWRRLTDISSRDFTPVMLINRDPAAILVRTDDTSHPTLGALLDDARQRVGVLTASGTALGGIWHLALAGALDAAGLDPASITWVPMNGAAPALQELLSGGIDIVASSLPEAETFLASGRVRSLGVMAEERVPAFPTIPTLKEQGVHWTMGSWRGIGLPAGTPQHIVDRAVEAMTRIVSGQTVVNDRRLPELMEAERFTLWPEPPDEFQATLSRTDAELGRMLESGGLSSVQAEKIGAMDFPRVLFVALGLVILAFFFSAVRERRNVSTPPTSGPRSARLLPLFEVAFAVLLYALVAEELGFIVTGSLILFVLLWRLGNRLVLCTLVTVLLVPAIYGLFATLLRVPLPQGLLGW